MTDRVTLNKIKELLFKADCLNAEALQLNNLENGIDPLRKLKEYKKVPKYKDGHLRQKQNGIYEIRFRKYGYNKSFSSKNKSNAIFKFKEFIKELNIQILNKETGKTLFKEWADKYMFEIKKPLIKEVSFKTLLSYYNNYVLPPFKNVFIQDIKQIQMQVIINNLYQTGKTRTLEDVAILFKNIFLTAKANNIILTNPMSEISIPKHRRINGTALSIETEKEFIKAIQDHKNKSAFLFMLYSGVRVSELIKITASSINIKENIITCICSKVKGLNKTETLRYIPISPKLKEYLKTNLSDLNKFKEIKPNLLSEQFKRICPNHHLHELRHTFVTRARESKIDNEIVSLWTGHSQSGNTTSKIYTHFSMEYQQKEMLKLMY